VVRYHPKARAEADAVTAHEQRAVELEAVAPPDSDLIPTALDALREEIATLASQPV
jgi:hypothetical protein